MPIVVIEVNKALCKPELSSKGSGMIFMAINKTYFPFIEPLKVKPPPYLLFF